MAMNRRSRGGMGGWVAAALLALAAYAGITDGSTVDGPATDEPVAVAVVD